MISYFPKQKNLIDPKLLNCVLLFLFGMNYILFLAETLLWIQGEHDGKIHIVFDMIDGSSLYSWMSVIYRINIQSLVLQSLLSVFSFVTLHHSSSPALSSSLCLLQMGLLISNMYAGLQWK